ncbi:TNFAIP3-interacting protein 1-like isoform X4 [Chiloscyllium plagiosum]|uniref:TNFAIP3-interacting protein 1-like isoform X4 n=1 Tax=Chiloscyllium plagiosum TaxID=36176 RepID=UPI001CB7BF21|nr:TNFAIP3-interacting protein 1-like isoform X4 [Chiloscyllium plagiosum]
MSTETQSWSENENIKQKFEIVPKDQWINKNVDSPDMQKNVTGMEIENQRSLSTDGKEAFERQIKILENQKKELLKINKQWDQEFRNMKAVYEQKLKEKFTTYQHSLSDLEKELDEKQRDFDKKLLLAKAKLETAEEQKQSLNAKLLEAEEENKHLKECHSSITKQKGYYEHEIARLNKVQIFEEDFQKERCDRERMNEEKEELKKNIEHLQSKLTLLNTRLKTYEEDFIKERKEKDLLGKKLKKQATGIPQSPATPYPPLAYAPCAPYINYGHPYGIPVHYPGPAFMMPQTESRGYQQHPMPECPWYLPYSELSPDQQNVQKCRPKDITSAKRNAK